MAYGSLATATTSSSASSSPPPLADPHLSSLGNTGDLSVSSRLSITYRRLSCTISVFLSFVGSRAGTPALTAHPFFFLNRPKGVNAAVAALSLHRPSATYRRTSRGDCRDTVSYTRYTAKSGASTSSRSRTTPLPGTGSANFASVPLRTSPGHTK